MQISSNILLRMAYSLLLFIHCSSLYAEPIFWLTPLDPTEQPAGRTVGAVDYFDLFGSPDKWGFSRAGLKVFKVYSRLIQNGKPNDLQVLFRFLKDNGIELALETGVLTSSTACGIGVESFNGQALVSVVQKISNLGGKLSYIAMDEPLWYGTEYSGKNACKLSIESASTDAIRNISGVYRIFPDVKIGDIEPVGQKPLPGNWSALIEDWVTLYNASAERPLTFLDFDIDWDRSWQPMAQDVASKVRAHEVSVGVLLTSGATSDAEWSAAIVNHFLDLSLAGLEPTQVDIQTWTEVPTHVLPETLSGTMTFTFRAVTGIKNDRSRIAP